MQHLQILDFLPASAPFSTLLPPTKSPIPTLPADARSTLILVRITNVALNHVDLLYARGRHQNNAKLVRPPFTPGSEFAGIVADAGAASPYQKGDRVYGGSLGAFSTHIVVDSKAVRKLPASWSLRDAAGLPGTLPVAYGCLVRCAKLQKGESVLVPAATGGIGVMLVQVAQAMECHVIATVGTEAKRDVLVQELGMKKEDVVLYGEKGWEARVKERTNGGAGVDVVVDLVGLVEESIRCCKFGGRVVVGGFAGRGGQMEKLSVNRILLKEATLIGYRYGESNRRNPDNTDEIWRAVELLMRQNRVKPVTYHEHYVGLESIPKAMEAADTRKLYGKAIIDIAPEVESDSMQAKL